jgi:hypothetical protein
MLLSLTALLAFQLLGGVLALPFWSPPRLSVRDDGPTVSYGAGPTGEGTFLCKVSIPGEDIPPPIRHWAHTLADPNAPAASKKEAEKVVNPWIKAHPEYGCSSKYDVLSNPLHDEPYDEEDDE